jgi:hypothetical protein
VIFGIIAAQIPGILVALGAYYRSQNALNTSQTANKQSRDAQTDLANHTDKLQSSTPFSPSELDIIGHAARSVARDYLQELAEAQDQPFTLKDPK